MSSSSDSSGPSSDGGERAPEQLAKRILTKLGRAAPNESMAVAEHRKATDAMMRLRDVLLSGTDAGPNTMMCLTCAGVAIHRRIALGTDCHDPGVAQQLMTTLALLFVLVMLCQYPEDVPSGSGPTLGEEPAMDIAVWERSSLEKDMRAIDDEAATSSWDMAMRDAGALCYACLQQAKWKGRDMSLSELSNLGGIFFRCSAHTMAAKLFDGAGTPSAPSSANFLTLSSLSFVAQANDNIDENLVAIADCAESEAGQTVLRDLILSFRLPRVVVGVRRTCLLGRDSNKIATEQYSDLLGSAHDAAMRGAKWSLEKDSDKLHKMCALLAGISVLMCDNAQSVRKDDMFYGRVQLPFLETSQPREPSAMRLALVEHSHEWIVYSMNRGQANVRLRQHGYDGFIQAILLFSNSVKSG